MSELFIFTDIADGIYVYPNPALKPSGWSSELGIKQAVKYKSWVGYLDIAYFLMQYDDMMEFSFGKWGEDLGLANFGGAGFKSINVGKTQISGIEVSISGQGKINKNTKINLLAGYTYLQPISLEKDIVYANYDGYSVIEPYDLESGEYQDGDTITAVTYNNSSSDPSVLKYRYQHIAKLDVELIYKKLSLGTSLRFNDFMKNVDAIFTDKTINEGFGDGSGNYIIEPLIPGVNESRKNSIKVKQS